MQYQDALCSRIRFNLKPLPLAHSNTPRLERVSEPGQKKLPLETEIG